MGHFPSFSWATTEISFEPFKKAADTVKRTSVVQTLSKGPPITDGHRYVVVVAVVPLELPGDLFLTTSAPDKEPDPQLM